MRSIFQQEQVLVPDP